MALPSFLSDELGPTLEMLDFIISKRMVLRDISDQMSPKAEGGFCGSPEGRRPEGLSQNPPEA